MITHVHKKRGDLGSVYYKCICSMDQIPPEWKFIHLLTEDEVIELLYGTELM